MSTVQPIPAGFWTVTPNLIVADGAAARAVEAGARAVNPVEDHSHGDRAGSVRDPFGHRWAVATHIEDVSPEELERRMEEMA